MKQQKVTKFTNSRPCLRSVCQTFSYLGSAIEHVQSIDNVKYDPGCETPLESDQVFATEFHGEDGLGDIYAKGLHVAPTDWETQLLHHAESEGSKDTPFRTTPRDAADEILHQLANADPLTVTILAIGPLTNLALAIQRDPKTFSRAKSVVILGGYVLLPPYVDIPTDEPTAHFRIQLVLVLLLQAT